MRPARGDPGEHPWRSSRWFRGRFGSGYVPLVADVRKCGCAARAGEGLRAREIRTGVQHPQPLRGRDAPSVRRVLTPGHSPPEEVANVPVTVNLNWRPFHNDGSMDEGATAWGYLLLRETADSPWRIFDQGTG
jgi:hypothetical protein